MEYSQASKLDFSNYEELLKSRAAQFTEKTGGKKVEHSFQELGLELQQYFGKGVWWLFYKYKEEDIRRAFGICQRNGKTNVNYLVGCIKRQYGGFS